MTLREALHAFIRDNVNVSVHEGRLPTRPMMPAIVQRNISGRSTQTHTSPASLLPRRIQFDAYADNDSEVDQIALRLIAALDGFHGPMNGVSIGWIALLNDLEMQPVEIKGGIIRFRRILDFEIASQQQEVSSS